MRLASRFSAWSVLALAVALLPAAAASAQATRTWVSGVGDDANPCSRTAPCKTFAGAISKTATGGAINVLDPGGFGAVTITKSITISGEGVEAGVLAAGTNGVVINAPSTAVVVLRGLDIDGVGVGINGIRFVAGGTLHVENCTIGRFLQKGIAFEPTTVSELFVVDTIVRNNKTDATSGGIFVRPALGGSARVTLDRVQMVDNQFGLRVQDGTVATVRHSNASGNTTHGFLALLAAGGTVELHIESSEASNNAGDGVRASQIGSTITVSNVHVTGNAGTGLAPLAGAIISFGNNRVTGNAVDGAPTATVPQV